MGPVSLIHHRSPLIRQQLLAAALAEKLATRHDALNYRFKTAAVIGKLSAYLLNQKIVGEREAASQSIGQQLTGKAAHEIVFAVVANVLPDALQSLSFDASGEGRSGVDRAPAQTVGSTPADRIKSFECQSERVEPRVTGGATRVGPMPLQHLTQR